MTDYTFIKVVLAIAGIACFWSIVLIPLGVIILIILILIKNHEDSQKALKEKKRS